MNYYRNRTDEYYVNIVKNILNLAPIIGISAGVTITVARLCGYFDFVGVPELIFFDIMCLSYYPIARHLGSRGILVGDSVDENKLFRIQRALSLIVILQWNLITYIFPTRDFWGYAPMFVLLTAFLFKANAVAFTIGGISVSIAISWLLKPDELLPYPDGLFTENLVLRIVALVISFGVIYILTALAERFTKMVNANSSSLEAQNEELEKMSKDIIDFAADIIEQRDYTSGSHVKRLKAYTKLMAECVADNYPEYELTREKIEHISTASALHDVGKIAIPDSILLKPGKLTPDEFEQIKSHTTTGGMITEKLPESLDNEYKKYCREICRYHHEKYDGGGYPCGLKGDEIPISAQIVSVVDCFDALTTDRPYKNAYPGEVAVDMIMNGECGVFNEKMMDCLICCKNEFIRMADGAVD